jgi:hypothetical protein
MNNNFFSVLKLNPLRTFHVESLTSPVTPCHVRLYTLNVHIYIRVLRNFNSGLGYYIIAAAPQFACRVRF